MNSQTTPRTVLILGAAGRFGGAATEAFANAGWRVLAQARKPLAALPRGARWLKLPLDDTAALAQAAAGASVVVHAINPLYTRWATDVMPLGRQGMAVAQQLGATFMLPGNIYNHGTELPALLSEDAPQTANTRKGRIRCELEAEMQARSVQGLRSVVIRAGDFFGSGTGSWLDLAIAKSLRAGKLVYPGPLDRPHAWAYLPDLAQAFVAAAGLRDGAAFTALHFAGHTLTGAELLAAIERNARVLGLAPAGPLRRGGLPWRMIRLGGLLVPIWRELAEMQYLWDRPHALDGRRMRALLGPLPATPLDEALQQSLRAMFGGAAGQRVSWAPAPERPEIAP